MVWRLVESTAGSVGVARTEPSNDSELRTVFDEIDIDSSGELNRGEIYKLLDSLGRKPTQDQLDKFMARMDPDGSGEVIAQYHVDLMRTITPFGNERRTHPRWKPTVGSGGF
jgi:Ca2+-binding EF-hand superfamily protein